MSIPIPDDPAPNGYMSFPFQSELDEAVAYFRIESVSEDGWETIVQKSGVLAEKKYIPGDTSALPLVRGRGVFENVTPAELSSVFSLAGVRLVFDDYTRDVNLLAKYSQRVQKFYSVQKGAFLVQDRDVVGVQATYWNEDGSIEVVQTGVPDDGSTPPVSGKTRATLTVGGWALRPRGNDTEVTYLLKTNPNGSIPAWLIRTIIVDYPLLVAEASDFYTKFGRPPAFYKLVESVVKSEQYHHDKREWVARLIGQGGDAFEISVDDKRMYSRGYDVKLDGEAKDAVEVGTEGGTIRIRVGDAADGKSFSITVSAKAG